MVMIIVGLYSFLWGRRKETKCLPQPNAGIEELGKADTKSGEMQLKTLVIPITTSPVESVYDMEEGALKDTVKS